MTLNMKKNGTMNSNIQQTDKTQTLLPDLLFHDLGKGVLAFSTCRGGGVGIGPYSSFNINAYCGDSEEHIKRNRSLLLNFLKLDSEHLIMPHQTHGVTVAAIDAAYFEYNDEQRKACLEGVDALITNLRGVCIGVSTADCIPILCYDATCGIVAAIHAGWFVLVYLLMLLKLAMKSMKTSLIMVFRWSNWLYAIRQKMVVARNGILIFGKQTDYNCWKAEFLPGKYPVPEFVLIRIVINFFQLVN